MVMPRALTNREIILIAVFLVTLLIIVGWAGHVGQNEPPNTTVTFDAPSGMATFKCEVADTPYERAIGLMDRESLDEDMGMLFVFESTKNVTFWMKDTLIPLDIIFIDDSGRVINIAQADPEPGVADANLATYSSASPAKWVIELNKGACMENGIMPGTVVIINMT